jgi:hypothetical protein
VLRKCELLARQKPYSATALRGPLAGENATMSRATVVIRDRLPPEATAQWWRMACNTSEEVVITEDDPERPTVITWTFPDGLDTVVAPSLRRRHRSIHNNSNASGGGAASKHVSPGITMSSR